MERLKSLLRCPICNQVVSDPHIIDAELCSHLFCGPCIATSGIGKELECTICKIKHRTKYSYMIKSFANAFEEVLLDFDFVQSQTREIETQNRNLKELVTSLRKDLVKKDNQVKQLLKNVKKEFSQNKINKSDMAIHYSSSEIAHEEKEGKICNLHHQYPFLDDKFLLDKFEISHTTFLPGELWSKCFYYLDIPSVCCCIRVCKIWRRYISGIGARGYWRRAYKFVWGSKCFKRAFMDGNGDTWKSTLAHRWPIECNWRTNKSIIKTLQGHEGTVTCLDRISTTLVTGSDDGSLICWSLSDSSNLDDARAMLYSHGSQNSFEVTLPQNHRSGIELMQQHHKQTRAALATTKLYGHGGPVWCCSADEDYVVSGSYDKTIKIWSLSSGNCIRTLRAHTGWVSCVSYNASMERIISGSWDSSIRVWDSKRGIEISAFQTSAGNSKYCLDWNVKTGVVVTGCRNHDVQLWDITRGQIIQVFSEHDSVIQSVWNDDSCRHLVSGSEDKCLKIWDPSAPNSCCTLQGHSSAVMGVQSDGDYRVVSCSYDKTIKIWDLRMVMSTFECTDIWSRWSGNKVATRARNGCIGSLEAHSGAVFCVQFDEEKIFSGSADKSAKIFQF